MAIPYLACMALVAHVYDLPPRVLPSIQAVEGGQVGTIHPNKDGTEDFGVMQVNTRWIGPIARYAHMNEADVRARLISDACFNIAAAGLIMRTFLNEAHGDLLRGVAYYHSHTPTRGSAYLAHVMAAATKLFVARTADEAPAVTAAAAAPGASATVPAPVEPAARPARTRATKVAAVVHHAKRHRAVREASRR
jgi:hypothetical protein